MSGLVLWDFDGTLAERVGGWHTCLVEVLQEGGAQVEVDGEALLPFLREGFPWHRPDVAHPELCSADAWWEHLMPVLGAAYEGVGIDGASARRLASLVRERYTDARAGWRVFDDTVPALRSLSEHGWRHVILSNHVPELGQIVDGLDLGGYIEEVLCSAVTGYEKPHPEAFAAGLRLRRRGEPVWMVGDNPHADVEGAERAGIPGLLVRKNGVGLLTAAERIGAP